MYRATLRRTASFAPWAGPVPPRAVQPVERPRLERAADPLDLRGGERHEVREAPHERDVAIRHGHHDVAREEGAAARGPGRPVEHGRPGEVAAEPEERQASGEAARARPPSARSPGRRALPTRRRRREVAPGRRRARRSRRSPRRSSAGARSRSRRRPRGAARRRAPRRGPRGSCPTARCRRPSRREACAGRSQTTAPGRSRAGRARRRARGRPRRDRRGRRRASSTVARPRGPTGGRPRRSGTHPAAPPHPGTRRRRSRRRVCSACDRGRTSARVATKVRVTLRVLLEASLTS